MKFSTSIAAIPAFVCFVSNSAHAGGFFRTEDQNREFDKIAPAGRIEFELKQADAETWALANRSFTNRMKFKKLRCADRLKSTPADEQPRINLVYEAHGTKASRSTMKAVLENAVAGSSLALLESDTGQDSFALKRTISNYGLPAVETKNVRGIDADLRSRTTWFLDIFANSLEETGRNDETWKVVEADFAEELLHNSDLRQLVTQAAKNSTGAQKSAARYAAFAVTARSTPHADSVPIARLLSLIPSRQKQEFKSVLAAIRERVSSEALSKRGKNSAGLSAQEEILNTGYNKRDEAFLDEVGNSICESLERKIPTINVVIGAGHREGLTRRLNAAFAALGAPKPDIETFNAEIGELPAPKGLMNKLAPLRLSPEASIQNGGRGTRE